MKGRLGSGSHQVTRSVEVEPRPVAAGRPTGPEDDTVVDRSGGQAARGDRPHKPGKTYFKRRSDRHAEPARTHSLSEWVRGLRAYGISSPSGRQAICRSSILRTSQEVRIIELATQAGIQRIPPQSARIPPSEFRGAHTRAGPPVPAPPHGRDWRPPYLLGPWPSAASAPAALARGLGVMAALAHALPVRPVPEQHLVAAMGHDMVDHGRRLEPTLPPRTRTHSG